MPRHKSTMKVGRVSHGSKARGIALRDCSIGQTEDLSGDSQESSFERLSPDRKAGDESLGVELRRPNGLRIQSEPGVPEGSKGSGRARVARVEETGRRSCGLKQWAVFYTGGVPMATVWVPDTMDSELFVDMMSDIQAQEP